MSDEIGVEPLAEPEMALTPEVAARVPHAVCRLRFATTCRVCEKRLHAGTLGFWEKGLGVRCTDCSPRERLVTRRVDQPKPGGRRRLPMELRRERQRERGDP